jgi:hypothetical protein
MRFHQLARPAGRAGGHFIFRVAISCFMSVPVLMSDGTRTLTASASATAFDRLGTQSRGDHRPAPPTVCSQGHIKPPPSRDDRGQKGPKWNTAPALATTHVNKPMSSSGFGPPPPPILFHEIGLYLPKGAKYRTDGPPGTATLGGTSTGKTTTAQRTTSRQQTAPAWGVTQIPCCTCLKPDQTLSVCL